MNSKTFIFIVVSFLLYGFGGTNQTETNIKGDPNMVKAATIPITIKSSVFQQGQAIPAKYTCDGENISPSLKWGEIPTGTQSIALICEDPDAPMGTWTHWLIWNIPGNKTELAENMPKVSELPDGVCQGINSGKKVGYSGPCPPDGMHRYYFKVYALDSMLNLQGDVSKEMLTEAMNGHVIAEGSIMGTYQRK